MAWEAAALLAWRAWRGRAPGAWPLAGAAGLAALVGLAPLGLNLLYTGRVTPNAAEAKLILYKYADVHPLHVAFIWARSFTLMVSTRFWAAGPAGPFFVYALPLALAGGFRRAAAEALRGRPGPFLIAAAWLATNWALAAMLQPAQMDRYLIAGYPLFTIFLAVGMTNLARALGRPRPARRRPPGPRRLCRHGHDPDPGRRRPPGRRARRAGRELGRHLPPAGRHRPLDGALPAARQQNWFCKSASVRTYCYLALVEVRNTP